jgi:uncharacterized repeat protein (TIGR03803 family)
MHRQFRQNRAAVFVAIVGALISAMNLAIAQPLKPEVLFSFNYGEYSSGLTLGLDGNLYGTTGGDSCCQFGGIFQLTTNGVFTTLFYTNYWDLSGLALGGDGNFYSTASDFGSASLFRVTTNGALTTLYWSDGPSPSGVLTQGNDGAFYGTTMFGGGLGPEGIIFRVTTNGELTTVYTFTNADAGFFPIYLTLGCDGNFYSTTYSGGSSNLGKVFMAGTNGVVSTLCSFAFTNGAYPEAPLILGSDGNFYGTTAGGGSIGCGTVFQLTTNGVLTTLASFAGTNGAFPSAGLCQGPDGNFYGTTSAGGNSFAPPQNYGNGTVFQVTTNGVLTRLVSFTGTNGFGPSTAALTVGSDGSFYGTESSRLFSLVYRLRHGVFIQSVGMTPKGFQLNTINVGGSGWTVLESSSDLMTWTPIQTNGTAAAQTFLDPAALTQPHQFYRVRQQ